MTGFNARLRFPAENGAAVFEAIDQGERNVFLIREAALDCSEDVLPRIGIYQCSGKCG